METQIPLTTCLTCLILQIPHNHCIYFLNTFCNHMHSHLDALQAMAPVDFRRVPSDFHSVAKQASFYIALGAHFQGFWEV